MKKPQISPLFIEIHVNAAVRLQIRDPMDRGTYKNINTHGIGDNKRHLEWCPKYRYECMQNPLIAEEMKQILMQIAVEKGIVVHKTAVDSDHVHIFVSVPLDMSVSTALQYLKGISAYRIFRLHPNFRLRYPKGHFWSRGHFSRSVSCVTESAIEHYIDNHEYPAMQSDPKQRLYFHKSFKKPRASVRSITLSIFHYLLDRAVHAKSINIKKNIEITCKSE